MKRLLLAVLGILIGLPLLLWGGFRIWLVNQDDSFRASIEQFSTLEFIEVVYDHVVARPIEDRAGTGRREYPGRGNSPWVIRSSLDGRPRMLAIALGPELWLAYSTETASIHQFWKGDVDYTGPVYDARHGFEPTSRGFAYSRPPLQTAWRILREGTWQPATVRWRGHGFDPANGALWIRYEIGDGIGPSRSVTERPERLDGSKPKQAVLERRFEFGAGPAIALSVDQTGGLEVGPSVEREDSYVLFARSNAARSEARVVHRYDEASIALSYDPDDLDDLEHAPLADRKVGPSEADARDPFASYDCHTCHNVRERVVGPAWSEIALRYAGMNKEISIDQLATRIIEGSEGRWGTVPMIPHPDLGRAAASRLAEHILETEPSEAPTVAVDDGGAAATWSFRSDTEEPPATLHPSLTTTPIDSSDFTPLVGGLAWLPDGRLAVSTWDRDGAVFAIEGWDGPREEVRVERIAEGLHEPLGLAVVDDALYVMQKQEITQLLDHDGDGRIDEYRTLANDWRVTSNFHEFGFGLVAHDGSLYAALSVCVLNGGKSCREQTPDRGKVIRVSLETGEVDFIASGLRTPNGLGITPAGELFITDNQGDWLPASKLIRVREGDYYGWRAPGDARDPGPVTPPTLWLPQNEVGNSPTQPLYVTEGPYAGQILFGDIYNGGLKRAALDEVDGHLQGAAFHFSGGLEGPVNRLLAAPSVGFIVGQVGSRGNWAEPGKDWFGLEVVRFGSEPAFEPMQVVATPAGFDIHFSRPLLAETELSPDQFELSHWFYVPSEIYGGPKYDIERLGVHDVTLSADRRVASLSVDGLAAGRVVYLHLDPSIRSATGEPLWVNEAWYTMNVLPAPAKLRSGARGSTHNRLSATEQKDGWRLLFDGHSFDGWKIYGAEDDRIEAWTIEESALKFTRDVSYAGLIWNHINPFTPAAIDLMTKERFGDFELSIDWKISEGGNSGIFYRVRDEGTRLSWDLGMEMQVLDNDRHSDGQLDRKRAGDLYDLQSLASGAARPAGEWNTARIRAEGDHLQHWLNGIKTVDIVRGSPAWNRALADSKFAGTEEFGQADSGHFTLQDHGDIVWYRNVKIRVLPASPMNRE